MISNKKLNQIVTELFIRGRKLNGSTVFIIQSYFKIRKDLRLNSGLYFVMKIPNKQQLQQNTFSNSSDTKSKDFTNIYNKCTAKRYYF